MRSTKNDISAEGAQSFPMRSRMGALIGEPRPRAILLAILAACWAMAANASVAITRPPLPETHSDWPNVAGDYESDQAVCDARRDALGWPSQLTYRPTDDHRGECVSGGGSVLAYPYRGNRCPDGYNMKAFVDWHSGRAGVPDSVRYFGVAQYCEAIYSVVDRYADQPKQCPAIGNPIYPFTGAKRQSVELDIGQASFGLAMAYDSRRHLPVADGLTPLNTAPISSFGSNWTGSFHKNLVRQTPAVLKSFAAHRGLGVWESFGTQDGTVFSGIPSSDQSIVWLGGSTYRLIDKDASSFEKYVSYAQLSEIAFARSGRLTYTYSTGKVDGVSPVAGLLIKVVDHFGRSIQFNYEKPEDIAESRIYKVIGPDGQETTIGYDAANNVATVTWPDSKVKSFVYERVDLPWALTGIVDEDGKRFATYGYDAQGRAVSTEHAGGTNKYVAQWTTPPQWSISETYDDVAHVIWRDHTWTLPLGTRLQDPLGHWTDLGAELVGGMPRQTTRRQPGGSGCNASDSLLSYDGRGNTTSRVDFNGVRSCHAFEAGRNVETFRVEGMSSSDSCPADLAAYQVPAGQVQRKVSTKWHPQWKSEAQRAEPKRITTSVYNGQQDPVDSQHPTLNCAPGAPALPDGSAIAVVCKRYEQSTDDETGNLGFGAAVKETRSWIYTYNALGQMTQETDSRGKSTTYQYWPDTAFTGEGNAARGHQLGDLMRVTNALNQSTEHLEYNKRGQVLTTKFANGSQELREYHVRGWLTKSTLVPAGGGAGQVTQYAYFDTGLLKKVTQPDGSFAKYTWDDAHRLTDVADSVGNTVHYELDNLGHRKLEQFKDPQGALAKSIARTFDALGRMSSSTGLQ
jgi:YD repeat-containing protein